MRYILICLLLCGCATEYDKYISRVNDCEMNLWKLGGGAYAETPGGVREYCSWFVVMEDKYKKEKQMRKKK